MSTRLLAFACATVCALVASGASAQKLYKWTDENGQVHYSDSIPPGYGSREYAQRPEPQAPRDTEADQRAKDEIARHYRMLLETYSSVAEIEDLRDRRLALLESQIKLTESYLDTLRKKLVDVQAEAGDIAQTTAAIAQYQQTLARARADLIALQKSFEEDIARFRYLKGA